MAAASESAQTKRTAATSQRRTAPRASSATQKSSEPDIPSSVRADRPRQTKKTTTKKQSYSEPDIPQSVRADGQSQQRSRTQAARQAMQQANYAYEDELDIPTSRPRQTSTQQTRTNGSQTQQAQRTSQTRTTQTRPNPQRTTRSNTNSQSVNRGPSGRPTNRTNQPRKSSGSNGSQGKRSSGPKKGKQNNHRSPAKPKAKRPGLLSWLVALVACGGVGWFILQLMRIDILPTGLFVMLTALLVIVMGLLIFVWLLHTRRQVFKVILAVLVCAIGVGSVVGGYYLNDTDKMFSQITNLTDKQANTMTVFAMQESDIVLPKQLTSTMKVGIDPNDDAIGTEGAIAQLKEAGANFQTVTYDNPFTLVDALYNHEVDAIIFPENMHGVIYEEANDDNKYNALTTFTNVVDQFVYYSDRDETTINQANPVKNIMTDPFTVMVSGNDSYGSINQVTRSDVNMLVTVNPKTAQVLILSIPRDAYLPVSCKKNPSACSAVVGEFDKLTHSGLYGVAATESTLEDAFDVEINYYARINFSSLINIVDAVGGIDVYVDPGLEVERFYANGTEGVQAGWNHLNGERALAFVRERHAYVDGDNQRVRNQQIALKALLKAVLSPQMVVNYSKVMTALSTAFDTNMTAKEIKSLLTLELSRFPDWNIQLYSLPGEPGVAYSPAAQTELSVVYLGTAEVNFAKSLIDDVIAGKTIDPNTFPASTAGTAQFVPYLPGSTSTNQHVDGLWTTSEEEDPYAYDPYGTGTSGGYNAYGSGYDTNPYGGYDATQGYGGYGYENSAIDPSDLDMSLEESQEEHVDAGIEADIPNNGDGSAIEQPIVNSDPYNPYGSSVHSTTRFQASTLDDPYGVRTPQES